MILTAGKSAVRIRMVVPADSRSATWHCRTAARYSPVIAILREELGVRYPLATLKPYTSGRSFALNVQKPVGLDPSLGIVVLGRDGTLQLTDTAEAFLEKVDFDNDGNRDARRLYPLARAVPRRPRRPDHGFGEPTLTSGARTEAVAELVAAGESRERVAAVYNIDVDAVDAAVRCEHDHVAWPRARSPTRPALVRRREQPRRRQDTRLRPRRHHLARSPDGPVPAGAPDTAWLPIVGRAGLVVLTRDKRIRSRPIERQALLHHGVRACFLASGGRLDLFSQGSDSP